jgi:hypothetical protein
MKEERRTGLPLRQIGNICGHLWQDSSWPWSHGVTDASVTDDVYLMVFNATFNNSSAISWRSVLFAEETGVPGENNHTELSKTLLKHKYMCIGHSRNLLLYVLVWDWNRHVTRLNRHRDTNIPGLTLSHNVVSSTPRVSEIRTHNVCGDRDWLHR